jgi:hypothetical protein
MHLVEGFAAWVLDALSFPALEISFLLFGYQGFTTSCASVIGSYAAGEGGWVG